MKQVTYLPYCGPTLLMTTNDKEKSFFNIDTSSFSPMNVLRSDAPRVTPATIPSADCASIAWPMKNWTFCGVLFW
jgi:hypothetical protein